MYLYTDQNFMTYRIVRRETESKKPKEVKKWEGIRAHQQPNKPSTPKTNLRCIRKRINPYETDPHRLHTHSVQEDIHRSGHPQGQGEYRPRDGVN